MQSHSLTCTAFEGERRLASGELRLVALAVRRTLLARRPTPDAPAVLIFDDATGKVVEVDFRGTQDEVLKRLDPEADAPPRGPGRPKLGVVAREVTLLPRHWEWLQTQPGGASVALRKLVEEARRAGGGRERVRRSQEAAYEFMRTMAGNAPGYEEALRALFAGQRERFIECTAGWPADIAEHSFELARGVWRVDATSP